MALADVEVPYSPAWWMSLLARRLLAPDRMMRFATLDAYRRGFPPLPYLTPSQRQGFHSFNRLSRTNFARVIVRTPAERMAIRAIRTAAANDVNGDAVALRYFKASGLGVAQTDVHSDMLTFSETYVRVAVNEQGQPVALKRDPRYCISVQDPINPLKTIAAFELVWDDIAGKVYAYLWLPGEQWVAESDRKTRPLSLTVPGTEFSDRRWKMLAYYPRLSFSPASFTMRPNIDEVPEDERTGPYSETFEADVVPVFRFENRDGIGEFEEHLDVLDRINYTILTRVVTAAIQTYKQRALEQDADAAGTTTDRLPDKDPTTGEPIDWDSLFQPGPDALWKLPPGVKIWESGVVDLNGILAACKDDLRMLSSVTSTPFNLFAPDTAHQSAEGAQLTREGGVSKVEDRDRIAERRWAEVVACMFLFAPDADRYAGDGADRMDRADASQIVIDWEPAERYSLAEKAQADSQNKSLSRDMAAVKIWGLTPDEVAANRAQAMADQLLAAADMPPAPGGPDASAA